MKKHVFYSELAYIIGLILIAAGVVFSEKADFGVSMVVAPAYLLYRWLNPVWSFFTFGMAEYCTQALLILLMAVILKRFKRSFILCFVTAVIYGFILDGLMLLGGFLPTGSIFFRVIWYILGVSVCAAGVSLMFHSYITPEAYELFVKDLSEHFNIDINKFKTIYDCTSCVLGLIMSFAIFGLWKFVGVSWGTVLCALINGSTIGAFSKLYEKFWEFRDGLNWRTFFEQK